MSKQREKVDISVKCIGKLVWDLHKNSLIQVYCFLKKRTTQICDVRSIFEK